MEDYPVKKKQKSSMEGSNDNSSESHGDSEEIILDLADRPVAGTMEEFLGAPTKLRPRADFVNTIIEVSI